MIYCVFCLLVASVYTAELTALLSNKSLNVRYNSLDEAVTHGATICSKSNTAYSNWLSSAIPGLKKKEFGPSLADLVSKLMDDTCDALVVESSTANYAANSHEYCNDGMLSVVGQPLGYGLTDMAVGVRTDLSCARDAISYWITVLRACSIQSPQSDCYLRAISAAS